MHDFDSCIIVMGHISSFLQVFWVVLLVPVHWLPVSYQLFELVPLKFDLSVNRGQIVTSL